MIPEPCCNLSWFSEVQLVFALQVCHNCCFARQEFEHRHCVYSRAVTNSCALSSSSHAFWCQVKRQDYSSQLHYSEYEACSGRYTRICAVSTVLHCFFKFDCPLLLASFIPHISEDLVNALSRYAHNLSSALHLDVVVRLIEWTQIVCLAHKQLLAVLNGFVHFIYRAHFAVGLVED